MTVFKAFLQVLNRCKGIIIMYTVILVTFGGLNMRTSDNSISFTESKPDILVVNYDKDSPVSRGLIEYLGRHANFPEVGGKEEEISDALFYRDVNYIIYIPGNFGSDILSGLKPEVEIKATGDYPSHYAQMLLEKYVGTAQCFAGISNDEIELEEYTASALEKETDIEVTTKLDTSAMEKAAYYFNFMNYGLLAGAIFTICTVLSSFNSRNIRRRTVVSCMDIKKYNRILLLANSLFALVLWLLYAVLGFVLCGSDTMATTHGLILLLNSFIFTICTVTIAFLIASLVNNKNALNGIINVVALGSSFLCGSFVPSRYLPKGVLNVAHILPSYWYIRTNDAVAGVEKWNAETLTPLLINMGIVLGFSVLFVIISNIISVKKRD